MNMKKEEEHEGEFLCIIMTLNGNEIYPLLIQTWQIGKLNLFPSNELLQAESTVIERQSDEKHS
jgi:hypothetical protein